MKTPKIPKGWRALNEGDMIQPDDKVWSYNVGPWKPYSEASDGGFYIGKQWLNPPCCNPAIRRQSARTGRKGRSKL